jgi:hypothetical protein
MLSSMFTTTYPTRKKPPPHPKRAEVEELGRDGVLKKYGSYWKAAEALGVSVASIYLWAPTPARRDGGPKKGRPSGERPPTQNDPAYPDLPPRAAFCLRKIIGLTQAHGGRPPTRREVASACGVSSTNGVQDHFKVLIREGYLVKGGTLRSRDFKLTDKAVPPLPREDIAVLMRLAFRVADRHETMLSASRVLDWFNKTKETP